MPLDDRFMLPPRVRTMAQMADLLHAERLMIDRLETDLAELLIQGNINNNTTLTKERLEYISSLFANSPCRVDEFPDDLAIYVVVSRNGGSSTNIREIVDGIDVLVPAHLKYHVILELSVTVGICISGKSKYYPYDLCGYGFAGELPIRNIAGVIHTQGVQIGFKTYGATFQPPLAGTSPVRNVAGAVYAEDVQIGLIVKEAIFQSPLSGIFPVRNTTGEVREGGVSDGSSPCVTTYTYPYEIDYCGTGYCGEEGE